MSQTKKVLKKLNIKLSDFKKNKEELKMKGYTIIRKNKYLKKNLKQINKIIDNLILSEGKKAGWEGYEDLYKKNKHFEKGAFRLGGLVYKHEILRKLILIPEVLALAYDTIKDEIKICSLNFRSPKKNCKDQSIHIDGLPRRNKNDGFNGIIAMFYLNDSCINSGPLRIIPYSHKKLGWPDNYLDVSKRHKKEINLFAKAGDIVIMNLNTWHAGAKNINGKSRKTIFLQIKRRDEPQLLNYKKYLSEKTKNNLNESQRYLLAIRDKDFTQKEDSVGPGDVYRKIYGKDRGAISRK